MKKWKQLFVIINYKRICKLGAHQKWVCLIVLYNVQFCTNSFVQCTNLYKIPLSINLKPFLANWITFYWIWVIFLNLILNPILGFYDQLYFFYQSRDPWSSYQCSVREYQWSVPYRSCVPFIKQVFILLI